MCLILFASGAHGRYPLIVAANRDESYARPASQAAFWEDHPDIFGGRDLLHGGTWMAISTGGRFAAITNYRQGKKAHEAPRSRGELTRRYLTGSRDSLEYLREVERNKAAYHGFSLIVGRPGKLCFYSNRAASVQRIAPGVHGLSNRLLDEPWPKVVRGVAVLSSLLESAESKLIEALFELLADRTPAPDHMLPSTGITLERERAVSAAFIASDSYGTRASTVLLVEQDGTTLFHERTFGPHGTPLGSTQARFRIALEATAVQNRIGV